MALEPTEEWLAWMQRENHCCTGCCALKDAEQKQLAHALFVYVRDIVLEMAATRLQRPSSNDCTECSGVCLHFDSEPARLRIGALVRALKGDKP